ncbi:hypothetical protein ONE63_006161 [Megalurothrips usitatus]|uniref:Nuclear receptor domain-containing protein n=1 Tax=Megalurothrips usitatus TaxID=439358 RepID=A0AAV7XZY0_9NEOP|nr:hypothetical protein ONE63_006161 [Megalurothrips usitatus]
MSQLCRVCGEPAAGFHFGAFTCEGCKSFFGRTYNNLGSITECKNQGTCVINKKNRTSCKACRLRKCLLVGMSKSGSRYGRRSNWFKIHCLLQEQQHQHQQLQPPPQQHAPPPPASPPEKSPKGGHPPHRSPRGVGLAPLPAAAAAAAAALNGGVPPPLFGVPPPGHPGPPPGAPRHEWSRLASPMSSGSTSPPASPCSRLLHKVVVAPRPPTGNRRLSSPRIDVDVDPDVEQAEQEQPMDLSRTAAACPARRHDADGQNNNCDGDDKDGSDSGVSERESDRVADGDVEGERQSAGRGSSSCASPGPRTAPVDLSARLSC